ncbi:hypothetical protein FKG94_18615 [Exilibacterium tricleocarpae]|uniref:Uncharacterized protein n=1 Tax=Exilibacterium tricleocarpae TaxID=2591008 RepID=A0A545T646_9GAMM|nr:hypothetical protein [Exilibacterium tricleocarpae]TQV72701.1 hypothetical protein FKG94_18615 [Exilibacterium tricleocarpae]
MTEADSARATDACGDGVKRRKERRSLCTSDGCAGYYGSGIDCGRLRRAVSLEWPLASLLEWLLPSS